MNFFMHCFIIMFVFMLGLWCKEIIIEDSLSENLLKAVESKERNDRFQNIYIIGKVLAKCIKENYRNKNNEQCTSKKAVNILQTKNNESNEIFNEPNKDSKNLFTIAANGMHKLIGKLNKFDKETNETNYEVMIETCNTVNPAKLLEDHLTELKIKYHFYIQSAANNHDIRYFRRLKNAWNSQILLFSAFTGICKAFGTANQSLPENIKEFDKLMKKQEKARKETYLHTTVKSMANSTFNNKKVLIEDLKHFRDLLNEMFEDLNIFAVISIPNGNIFIPPTTLSSSYLYHITNLNAHILIYPTLPSNTFKHIRETDISLLSFDYNTVGPLFGKGPYCFLNSNGTLILSKFYVDIESICNDRLSCILFESPMLEAATTNANIFLRNSNVDCGWFSSKDLFLLAKHTPKNDLYYEKEDKHYINIYLHANTRLNNTVFNVSYPVTRV